MCEYTLVCPVWHLVHLELFNGLKRLQDFCLFVYLFSVSRSRFPAGSADCPQISLGERGGMTTQENHVEQTDGLLQKAATAATSYSPVVGLTQMSQMKLKRLSLVIDKARCGCIRM